VKLKGEVLRMVGVEDFSGRSLPQSSHLGDVGVDLLFFNSYDFFIPSEGTTFEYFKARRGESDAEIEPTTIDFRREGGKDGKGVDESVDNSK
jgi:hypothetical protein